MPKMSHQKTTMKDVMESPKLGKMNVGEQTEMVKNMPAIRGLLKTTILTLGFWYPKGHVSEGRER
jgi:hypothetical protein